MTYATLMVHLELGQTNAGILQVAGDVADRFQSRIVGITAAQVVQDVYCEGYMSGDVIEADIKRLEKDTATIEAEFRSAFHGRNRAIEWRSRSMFGPLADYITAESRCADLILTGVGSGDLQGGRRRTDIGELVLQAGRPILVVPAAAGTLHLQQVVVCWKDTREARRAVSDALPLLKLAEHVDVIEIAPEADLEASRHRVEDVVAWLKSHGVIAALLQAPAGDDERTSLEAVFEDRKADLVVAGAYGHSRLREWVLGGISRDLLVHAERCSLLAH